MRDRQTLLAGIQAAETGHLVYVTLHTADTMQAFTRILEFFPNEEHPFIRSSLANSLRRGGTTANSIHPPRSATYPGDRGAVEYQHRGRPHSRRPRRGPAVHHRRRAEMGMHDFTSSLLRLVKENWVDLKMAERYAPNVELLRSRVRGIDVKSDVLVSKAKR